jgi:hypothetical protein
LGGSLGRCDRQKNKKENCAGGFHNNVPIL